MISDSSSRIWVAAAFLLGVIACDTLGDPDAAGRALQRALDLAEPPPGKPTHHFEALSNGEIRVLRYLQTNLSAREIADEPYISVNTLKTHQRHLYQKLSARSRTQAVEQAQGAGALDGFGQAASSSDTASSRTPLVSPARLLPGSNPGTRRPAGVQCADLR